RAEVRDEAPPLLERIAVGDHLLLGGDNMDITLARTAEKRIGQRLNASQFGALVQASRAAKELLLAEGAPERTSVAVAGAGSRLIGGTLAAELGREEVRALLLDGFFPRVAPTDAPARAARASGLAELGLPYAADPAITRHAAAFLQRHARTAGGSPRAYYVGVGDGGQAVCVVPRGAPEGVEQTLDRDFSLVLGRPVRFRLFASAGFRPERAGDLLAVDEELAELPPLQTVI